MVEESFTIRKFLKIHLIYNHDLKTSIPLVGLDTERTSYQGVQNLKQMTEGTCGSSISKDTWSAGLGLADQPMQRALY